MSNHCNFNRTLLFAFFLACFVFHAQVPSYIPTNGLMAWYPFTGNANDMWINAHNGTVNSATLTTDRFNASNSAFSFNGSTSNIVVQDNVNFRPASFTISSWIYFNTLSGTRMILAKNCGTGMYESIGSYVDASHLKSIIGTTSSYGQFLTAPNVLQTGQWYHYVDQFDDVNNLHKIFINGVMIYSVVENISIGYDAKPWTIGMEYENMTSTFYFSGKIDDIGIWDRILTASEIQQLYTSCSPVSAISSATEMCQGQSATLTAAGSNSYTWSPGNSIGSSIVVSPGSTTIFTVSSTTTVGCTSTATLNVNVNPNPSVAIIDLISGPVCSGSSVTLAATGALTYIWDMGIIGSNVVVSPAANTIYGVTGTDSNGCTGTATLEVSVVPNPTVTISSSASGTICAGTTVSLVARGALMYHWNNGSVGSNVVVSPLTTTHYTVTGTNSDGCVSSATVSQAVSVCQGLVMQSEAEGVNFNVYPNPFHEVLVIEINGGVPVSGAVSLEIVNYLGQTLSKNSFENGINSTKIATNELSPGIYIIKLTSENYQQNLKVIKE